MPALAIKGAVLLAAAGASWWAWSEVSETEDRYRRAHIALAIVGLAVASVWYAQTVR